MNLKEKLGLKCLEYFSLVVEDVRVPSHHKFIILQEQESLRQVSPPYCAVVFILCNMLSIHPFTVKAAILIWA